MAIKSKPKKSKPKKSKLAKGKTRTKKVTKGPNKGDTVRFRGSPSGKPFPVKVVKDVGKKNRSNVAKKQRKKKKK